MNPNCRVYALPSLCFSILPICRTPEQSNHQYFASKAAYEASQWHLNKKQYRKPPPTTTTINKTEIIRDKRTIQLKTPTRSTENVRRICRDECELLENELCQKEYAIAKRHPTIGQKLPLENCSDLPDDDDCMKLGIAIDVSPNENCFWENGNGYRGVLAKTTTGKNCIKWAGVMNEMADYPELAGQNYCRNPGGLENKPWCFVDSKKTIEFCAIPKCADRMWLYIIVVFVGLATILVLIIVIVFYKKFKKSQTTNIQNVSIIYNGNWSFLRGQIS